MVELTTQRQQEVRAAGMRIAANFGGLQQPTNPKGSSFKQFQEMRNRQLNTIRNTLVQEGLATPEEAAAVFPEDTRKPEKRTQDFGRRRAGRRERFAKQRAAKAAREAAQQETVQFADLTAKGTVVEAGVIQDGKKVVTERFKPKRREPKPVRKEPEQFTSTKMEPINDEQFVSKDIPQSVLQSARKSFEEQPTAKKVVIRRGEQVFTFEQSKKEGVPFQKTKEGRIDKAELNLIQRGEREIAEAQRQDKPGKAIVLGLGVTAASAGVGFAKGLIAPFNPQTYIGLGKAILNPTETGAAIGESLSTRPASTIGEFAGFTKGFGTTTRVVTRRLAQPKRSVTVFKPSRTKKPSKPLEDLMREAKPSQVKKSDTFGRQLTEAEINQRLKSAKPPESKIEITLGEGGKVEKITRVGPKEPKPSQPTKKPQRSDPGTPIRSEDASTLFGKLGKGDVLAGDKFQKVGQIFGPKPRLKTKFLEQEVIFKSPKLELKFPSVTKLKALSTVRAISSPIAITSSLTGLGTQITQIGKQKTSTEQIIKSRTKLEPRLESRATSLTKTQVFGESKTLTSQITSTTPISSTTTLSGLQSLQLTQTKQTTKTITIPTVTKFPTIDPIKFSKSTTPLTKTKRRRKRAFRGTPSLSVVGLGSKAAGTTLTKEQLLGKELISPLTIRKVL